MPPVQFALHSYQAHSRPLSAQRVVNYYAEMAPPDAKATVAMFNAPGLKAFCDGLGGAVRGAHVMNGVLYVVAGTTLYSIDSAGAETAIGPLNTTSGYVSMASNRASPQQMIIVDGADGWIYDTSNGLVEIVDAQFVAADTVTFQDGYFILNERGTSRFFISAIDDGTSYAGTDFADSEASSDAVVAVKSHRQTLVVFNEDTTEFFYNSGNNDFPFERVAGGVLERGCAAAFSIAADENTLVWLADDRTVRMLNGFAGARISTHAIEDAIRTMSDVSDAVAFFCTINGHKFYYLTFPTGRMTFVYDLSTSLWHERESFGQFHFRGTVYAYAYDKHLVGDAFVGRIGEFDLDTYTEFDGVMQGILTGPVIHNDRRRAFHRRFEVDVESGTGKVPLPRPKVNYVPYSENMNIEESDSTTPGWFFTSSTVDINPVTGPTGFTNTVKIVEDAGSGTFFGVTNQALSGIAVAGDDYIVRARVKAAGRDYAYLIVQNESSGLNIALFDIGIGAVGDTTAAAGDSVSSSIRYLGNGWHEISMTVTSGVGTETVKCGVGVANSAAIAGISYTGNGTSGVYVTGVQAMPASEDADYVRTYATVPLVVTPNYDPQMWLDWSDDGGRTWSMRKPFRSLGKLGEYRKRLRWLRLGQSRDRIYRLTISDPVKRAVIAAHADIVPGSN